MTTMTATTSSPTCLCSILSSKPSLPKSSLRLPQSHSTKPVRNSLYAKPPVPEAERANSKTLFCSAARRKPAALATSSSEEVGDDNLRRVLRISLWVAEGVYILWLFLLPYAPGDPVWAISSDTINSIVDLSLNFLFILPFMNVDVLLTLVLISIPLSDKNNQGPCLLSVLCNDFFTEHFGRVVGIRLIEAPVLHPMSEGLFNFVIAWTIMFGPLLYTDRRRDRYKGSVDVLWGLQMFLTNTFLIPYMAIRLNDADDDGGPNKRSELGNVMTKGASFVGLIGGISCLVCVFWALFGRMDSNFGGIVDRWEFLIGYLGSERLAYAFIWDICLYTIFQPWLIGDNLRNVQEGKGVLVNYLRYIPVVGLIAYLICLEPEEV